MRNLTILAIALALTASCTIDPRTEDDLAGGGDASTRGGDGGSPSNAGGSGGQGGMANVSGGGGASAGARNDGGQAGTPGEGGQAGAEIQGGQGGSTETQGGTPAVGGEGGSSPDYGDHTGKFYVFLTLGQSNMVGVPIPESADRVENPQIKVLAYDNCAGLKRTYNQWYTASPPLHNCSGGLGPGDYFARALASALRGATIGIVPNAINGADIDMFRKGVVSTRRNEYRIPPDNHYEGAYEWVLERAQLAQQVGEIRGILFHQGESDNTNPAWPGKVKGIVQDLKEDLGLDDLPLLVGELPYDGCCGAHNSLIAQLPGQIPGASVISAAGLGVLSDKLHFDLAAQRTFGQRYGATMLEQFAH